MGDEKIYVSMGEAFYKGEKDIDFDELYRHADSAMYKTRIIQATVRHLNA